MNEDVEVVHYAITAMVELSKEYDYRLQKIEKNIRMIQMILLFWRSTVIS